MPRIQKLTQSGATMWSNATERLCKLVEGKNAKAAAGDKGLVPMTSYRPPVAVDKQDRIFQVVLVQGAVKAGPKASTANARDPAFSVPG